MAPRYIGVPFCRDAEDRGTSAWFTRSNSGRPGGAWAGSAAGRTPRARLLYRVQGMWLMPWMRPE